MYLYIERCDCELVTAYPYNEFPKEKLLIDIRYMIKQLKCYGDEQLEDTVLPELDILKQAITNAQPYEIEKVLIEYLNRYGKKDGKQPEARVYRLDDEQNADYAIILSYNGKAIHAYIYCSLKHDNWESRIVYRDHFYDEESTND